MSHDIYDEAYRHFTQEGEGYEYGRGDKDLKNHSPDRHTDRSRSEQDLDHDGLKGVDCSSLVWRGLKNAGYDVGNSPFTTAKLFEGNKISDYSHKHFDVVSAEDARKPNGSLQQGDIVMFTGGHGQHVGIFKDYDAKGNMEFYGSQVSTGPALVSKGTGPGEYWNGRDFQIVGALRAKPEFRVKPPLHDGTSTEVPTPHAKHPAPTAPPAHPAHQDGRTNVPGVMREGERSETIRQLQKDLGHLGYTDANGKPLQADSTFGKHTEAAVKAFQHDHGLHVDGMVGPKTLEALQRKGPNLEGGSVRAAARMDDAAYPDHAMYRQALGAVHRLDAEHQRASDQHSANLAGALVVAARREGMSRIDHVALSDDGSRSFAVQGDLNSPLKRIAEVPTAEAVSTSLGKSTAALDQAAQARPAGQAQAAHQQEAQRQTDAPAKGAAP